MFVLKYFFGSLRLFETNVTSRKECRVVESEAKGSRESGAKAGSPSGVPSVGLSATRSERRSDPKRLERREVSGENVEGRQKTSERANIFSVLEGKKRLQEIAVLQIFAARSVQLQLDFV